MVRDFENRTFTFCDCQNLPHTGYFMEGDAHFVGKLELSLIFCLNLKNKITKAVLIRDCMR